MVTRLVRCQHCHVNVKYRICRHLTEVSRPTRVSYEDRAAEVMVGVVVGAGVAQQQLVALKYTFSYMVSIFPIIF